MNGNLFVRVSSYYIYSNGFCPNQLAAAHTGTIPIMAGKETREKRCSSYTENIEKSRAGFIGGAGSITRKNILLRV